LGELGLRALPYQNEALVFTPNLLSAAGLTSVTVPMLVNEGGYSRDAEGWWAPSGVQTLDPAGFYQPTALTDPWGNVTTVVYDSYALFVRSVTDPLGNTSSGDIDYQALQPYRSTDPNGDGSVVGLDALGRVTAVSVFGNAGEGDSTADPTARFVYYPNRWLTDRQPCAVYTATRERHADATTAWQEAWLYVDGHGNELMRKVPAAAGLAPSRDADGKLVYDAAGALVWKRCDPRWVGNGRTIVDNKGNPVRQYEPFFAPNEDYESDAEIVEWGVTPSLSYDPLGRNVRVDLPNGTFRTVSFDPWRQSTADENDNVLESAWYAARKDLPPANPEARAAKLTADHANTPTVTHLDALGRPFLTVQDNGASGLYETRVTLDIQGQARAVTDARGITTQTQRFDMLGRGVHEGSPDAGDTYALADLAGNPIHVWKSGDLHHWRQYDALRRPTHLIIEQSGTSTVAERLIYGEWHPDPAPLHLRGRLYRHYDGAGSSTVDSYDFKGNPLQTRRVLAASLPVDWTALDGAIDLSGLETLAKPLLERTGYKTSQTFDALNRPITQTTPDSSVTTFGYDAGGRMTDLSAALRGASAYTLFVNEIQYNAKGQRTKITYGNGVVTRYTYDDDTFRLSRLTSVRRSDSVKIQDLVYTYDPVGNITEILDRAQDTLYFNNAQVSPRAWYTYDALYRLVTSRGRERASLGMTSSADPTMGVMPDARTAVWGYRQLYTYDAVGNIKEMRHRTDDPSGNWTRRYTYATDSNRLLKTTEASGTVRYTHNVRGAMVNLPHLHQDGLGGDNVTVNHNDQMIGAQLNTSDTAEYAYDGAGQRVLKRVTKGANVETRVYIGAYELWTRTVRGATREQRETLHGMDGQQRVVMVETKTVSDGSAVTTPESRQRYQLGNHLGSASVELDQDGALIGYEEYHPYGTTSWQAFDSSAEVSAKRYKYTGMERDEETGLQCHGVRYYAGWLGRWTSTDPIGLKDGINRFRYSRDNPILHADRSGLASQEELVKDQIRDQLKAEGLAFNEQVTGYIKMPNGSEVRGNFDFVVRRSDGTIATIEAKGTPGQSLTANQQLYMPELKKGGASVRFSGENAKALGLDGKTVGGVEGRLIHNKNVAELGSFTGRNVLIRHTDDAGVVTLRRARIAESRLAKWAGRALPVVGAGVAVFTSEEAFAAASAAADQGDYAGAGYEAIQGTLSLVGAVLEPADWVSLGIDLLWGVYNTPRSSPTYKDLTPYLNDPERLYYEANPYGTNGMEHLIGAPPSEPAPSEVLYCTYFPNSMECMGFSRSSEIGGP
jgi:RHS repeat-associated protein